MGREARDELPAPLLEHPNRENPGDVAGLRSYGSGLPPDYGFELLMVTCHPLPVTG